MLRIAQLIESDGPGGAEQVVVDLAIGLQETGAHSVVFVPRHGEGWLAGQLAGSGMAIEYFDLNTPISPACARSLACAFARHRIDVAHSHEFSMAVYGAGASWLAGVHHVITLHGSRYYAGRLQRRAALRTAVALSDSIVAVSRSLANDISRDLLVRRSRVEVIANGVRAVIGDGAVVRQQLGIGCDDRLVVAVGNLYPVKGHVYLIDAVADLADQHPRLHLAIAGRGDLDAELTAHARRRRIADRVHLLGLRADVGAVLAAADVFALPSLSEGLPLALLEAMFAGRPIVASDVGEVAMALGRGEAGLLVPPGDVTALAAALNGLLTNPDRARTLAACAQQRAASEYQRCHMVRRYRSLYEDALSRSPLPLGSPSPRHPRSSF
jgi:glycosyltransferase involved in cell wall biosynthesis